jgi:uncharacterized protein DUF6587
MNGILDNALVGLALLASAGYAAISLGPRNLRRRILGVLSHGAARAPAFLGLGRIARRLAAASMATGACGGCDSCGGEQAAAQKSPKQKPSAAEVRVPMAKIGRRARADSRSIRG